MLDTHYILDINGEVKEEPDLLKWANWFQVSRNKHGVMQNTIGEYEVSTVFLGLDHNFTGKGVPILWETMVFERKETEVKIGARMQSIRKTLDTDNMFRRYATKEEALKGHEEIMKSVVSSTLPQTPVDVPVPEPVPEPVPVIETPKNEQ